MADKHNMIGTCTTVKSAPKLCIAKKSLIVRETYEFISANHAVLIERNPDSVKNWDDKDEDECAGEWPHEFPSAPVSVTLVRWNSVHITHGVLLIFVKRYVDWLTTCASDRRSLAEMAYTASCALQVAS